MNNGKKLKENLLSYSILLAFTVIILISGRYLRHLSNTTNAKDARTISNVLTVKINNLNKAPDYSKYRPFNEKWIYGVTHMPANYAQRNIYYLGCIYVDEYYKEELNNCKSNFNKDINIMSKDELIEFKTEASNYAKEKVSNDISSLFTKTSSSECKEIKNELLRKLYELTIDNQAVSINTNNEIVKSVLNKAKVEELLFIIFIVEIFFTIIIIPITLFGVMLFKKSKIINKHKTRGILDIGREKE